MQEGVWQWKNRTTTMFRDQWGREWEGEMDQQAVRYWKGHAPLPVWVGHLLPKFRAPILPPHEVLTPKVHSLSEIVVDCEKWRAMLREGQRVHREFMHTIVRALHPSNALEIMKDPTPEVRELAGTEPLPLLIVRAIERGDRYLLGFTDKKPKWLDAEHERAIARFMGQEHSLQLSADDAALDAALDDAGFGDEGAKRGRRETVAA